MIYEHYTRKINTTCSLLECLLWFLVIFAVLGLLCHHCYILVIRRSEGCTLQFRPLSTQRRFALRKSIQLAIFLPTVYDLRSIHPGKCLNSKKCLISQLTLISFVGLEILWFVPCQRVNRWEKYAGLKKKWMFNLKYIICH